MPISLGVNIERKWQWSEGNSEAITIVRKGGKKHHHYLLLSSLAVSVTLWYDHTIIIVGVWKKDGKKESGRKITISYFNTNALLGESRGLRVHVEALKGPRLSLGPPWLRRYGETIEGLQYSLRGQPGHPESCLIGKKWKWAQNRAVFCFRGRGLTRSPGAVTQSVLSEDQRCQPALSVAHLFTPSSKP